MSKTNVGANLVFARRTKTGIKPMFESEFETFASANMGTSMILCFYQQKFETFKEKHKIIDVSIYPLYNKSVDNTI